MGHIVKNCSEPVTSYGIILYRFNTQLKKIEYVLICRKHTIGYIEFIRGNYNIDNINYLEQIFDTMTEQEIENIYTKSFHELWSTLWNNKHKYNDEYTRSKHKFYNLRNNKYSIGIQHLVERTTQYTEPEWGFPKGRKNINETNIQTAERECYEETNIVGTDYTIQTYNDKEITFKEEYSAFNNKVYKLVYYLGHIDNNNTYAINEFNTYQKNEISNIGFYSLDSIIKLIRPYNVEKIQVIKKVDKFIQTKLLQ